MQHLLKLVLSIAAFGLCGVLAAQSPAFYFGSDLSYVNEMEDCGVNYKENGTTKDPYQIFADHGTNLVRLRLWHTPSWYDTLNNGNRYSDYADVCKSILRAKTAGMDVLLDFHLSDLWADPSRQIVPAAWAGVVNNLPVLQDSLYNYVKSTLLDLHSKGLLPELVQIGNETNRGIMLSEQQNNAGWQLNWARNAALFKKAIQAVRDVETATGASVEVALHVADPAEAGWLMSGFWNNGVQDFDIIGLSYYWAWHKPTTIAQTGNIIQTLKTNYPGKKVMIFETGYIWTLQSNDNASNIISESHPDYPVSPAGQLKWLKDLTQMVIDKGGSGVLYWEPAWVSSPCFTPWGQGSHQEHATFFDFSSNMLPDGGMIWPQQPYTNLPSSVQEPLVKPTVTTRSLGLGQYAIQVEMPSNTTGTTEMRLFDLSSRLLADTSIPAGTALLEWTVKLPQAGLYYVSIASPGVRHMEKLFFSGRK